MSPTTGWRNCLMPVMCSRTLCSAQRTRKSSLCVESSPTRSARSRSYGSRPAAARNTATTSSAPRCQFRYRSCARASRKMKRALLGGWTAPANISEYSARPSRLAARMSRRSLRTNAAAPVRASRMWCTLGRTRCLRARRRRAGTDGWAARARSNRCARSVVELQRASQSFEDAFGDAVDVAAFEPGVVRDADAPEHGDLFAAQPRHAPRAVVRQADLGRRELGPARAEEVADLPLRVHEPHRTTSARMLGDPARDTFARSL